MPDDSSVRLQILRYPQPAPPNLPEDFIPGESWATYQGRRADAAIRQLHEAELRLAKAESRLARMISDLRQIGESEAEIAETVGYSVEELQLRYPPPA